ncbi:unnamed protein product [Enterobius vermicularis]|uniref:ILEI domain-containing protein n=1 Tax=Enterobius vermicularis TaxID=51028 RepID=A0A0N4V028_ENTVE|nr:unnamed protein product [Enterobius vermicularis]
MSFYSGKNKDDAPRVCVNGRIVIDRDLNDAGRGLNLVVLDVKTREVIRVGHFDTYEQEDNQLISFLEHLKDGEILAVVSFDEAASRLSDIAKKIFYELGSSLIHDIKFRSSWYFVGQKGIDSFTPFEDMFAPSSNEWAKPIDLAVCVPLNLNSYKRKSDDRSSMRTNSARRHFCDNISKCHFIITALFFSSILNFAGLSGNSIRLCLESLMELEGLDTRNVAVGFDPAYPELGELAALFDFRPLPVFNTTSYNDFVLSSLSQMLDSYVSSPCIIVIEEDVVVSPDFLDFIGQLLDGFLSDSTANIIQLFNKNGIIFKIFYNETIFEKCCEYVDKWLVSGISYVPDVSRISMLESAIGLNNVNENRERQSIKKWENSDMEFLDCILYLFYVLNQNFFQRYVPSGRKLYKSSLN